MSDLRIENLIVQDEVIVTRQSDAPSDILRPGVCFRTLAWNNLRELSIDQIVKRPGQDVLANGTECLVFPHAEVSNKIGALIYWVAVILYRVMTVAFAIGEEIEDAAGPFAWSAPAIIRPIVHLH